MSDLHIQQWGTGDRIAVLVHGLTADSHSWWRLGPRLAEAGYRVLAPDLPGHGRSPHWPTYTLRAMADALVEAVPARPALALGHSLGALLLDRAVGQLQPERVVYVDPAWAPSGGPAVAESFLAQRNWTLEQIRAALPRWAPEAHQHKHTALAHWDPATLTATDGFPGHQPEPPAVPALVVLADPSALIPPQRAELLRRSGFTVRAVPNTGHVVHNEDFTGFWSVLAEWLRTTAEPAASAAPA